MAPWAKIKFFWKTMLGSEGSSLTASSALSGFDVGNIHNMMETGMWMASEAAGPHYIIYDAGVGGGEGADYLAV